MIYQWTEISNIPHKSGIYAWYYSPEITDYDLEKTINQIKIFKKKGDLEDALEAVRLFLYERLFQYFQEEPYQTILRGPLKPQYQGYVEHKPALSETLVSRIVEDPERLRTVKQVLEKSAPNFASPIYIGMSEDLKTRLKRHKRLIEKYRSQFPLQYDEQQTITDEKPERDRSFALQVCRRNITPTRLFVVISILEDAEKKYVDIENILNRIHYPLFGRN